MQTTKEINLTAQICGIATGHFVSCLFHVTNPLPSSTVFLSRTSNPTREITWLLLAEQEGVGES